MATRIHHHSYSGNSAPITGSGGFVPCRGNEVACKVYLKLFHATLTPTQFDNGLGEMRYPSRLSVSIFSLSNSRLQQLERVSWNKDYGNAGFLAPVQVLLRGSCVNSTVEGVGTGSISYTSAGVTQSTTWHVPEYFYLRPNDDLGIKFYTGGTSELVYHIELMAISES